MTTFLLLLFLATTGRPAAAQLLSADAAHLGTGQSYTALARGFGAVSLNPAGLAMPGSPEASVAVFPLELRRDLDPVSAGDVADFQGRQIPRSTREEWLSAVEAEGGQRGGFAGGVSPVSASVGRFGFQLSTTGGAEASLNPDAAELLLFGNAGRTGEPGTFDLAGSSLRAFAVTTAGLAYGHPVDVPGEGDLALGATLKYSVGNALLLARDAGDGGSSISGDPLEVRLDFPVLQSDSAFDDPNLNAGSGVGLDLGAAWEAGAWSVGAAVRNVFHTFEWDVGKLYYRSGTALLDRENRDSDFDARPASGAPASVLAPLNDLTLAPEVSLAAAYRATERLAVTAEARRRLGDGLPLAPGTRLAVGAEYEARPFLPLRAGVAKITDGVQFGGGAGVRLGSVEVGVAALARRGDAGDGSVAQLSVSYARR